MSDRNQTPSWAYLVKVGIISIAYFAVARLTLAILDLGIEASPLWPPAGLALAILLWQGRWAWVGVAIGMFWNNWSIHTPWILSLGSVSANTLQALLGATLLRWIGFRSALERLQDVLGFVALGVLASPLLGATIGNVTAYLVGQVTWPQMLRDWWTVWLGDSMGILVFTPWLLALRFCQPSCPGFRWRSYQAWLSSRGIERLLWVGLLIVVSWGVFYSHTASIMALYPIEYLPFPLIIWAALRFGQRSAICASFLLTIVAVSGTVLGYGPFQAKVQDDRQVILLLQAFIGVVTITALILASVASERRRAEYLLRQSQASLANAQFLARLGNWDYDFQEQQWNWSDELYRLLGFTPQSIEPGQQALLQMVHPDDRARVEQAVTAALTCHQPYQMDYRIQLPDGRERIVEEQVIVNRMHATGTVQDITERKRVEAHLRLTAERNRLLAETALRIRQSLSLADILNTTVQEVQQLLQADRVFISQFDAEGRGRIAAEAVIPGYPSLKDWMTEPSAFAEIQALFPHDAIRVIEDTSQIEATGFVKQFYDRYQVKAIIAVPIILDLQPFGPDQSELTSSGLMAPVSSSLFGILIVNQCAAPRHWQPLEIDLLEQLGTQVAIALQQGQLYHQVQLLNSNLEQQVVERTLQLKESLRELEELSQFREVFLHAIAHDLRTTVMGSLMVLKSLLNQAGDKIPVSRSLLERMTQSDEWQLNKLNSLLEAYSSKTEGITLQLGKVAIAPLTEAVISELQPLFEQNQTIVVNQISLALPAAIADAAQLQRVFKHLLTNAVKHNRPGVTVTLAARVEQNMLHCSVADNGKGISPCQRDRLFELCLGKSQERRLAGLSLGLYLCHQIVAAHGGQFGVVSELDEGTEFWFTVPIEATPCTSS